MLGRLELDERLDAGKPLLARLHDGRRRKLFPHHAAHLQESLHFLTAAGTHEQKKEKKKRETRARARGSHVSI